MSVPENLHATYSKKHYVPCRLSAWSIGYLFPH